MTNLLGIDVSVWDDDHSTPQRVDFGKARAAGAGFVFIKASQSTWADRDFLINWQNGKTAGIARGAYHFLTWDTPVKDQARFFAGLLHDDAGELPPVVDFECREGAPNGAVACQMLYNFAAQFKLITGKTLMIYTSPSYWREYGSQDYYWAQYPLWIAHYGVSAPSVPTPWKRWDFWQYTDRGDGLKFGCESKMVDVNQFNGDAEEFTARYPLAAVSPSVPSDPPAIPAPAAQRVIVDGLRLRDEPSLAGNVQGLLSAGTALTVRGERADATGGGTWLRVTLEGWVAGKWQGKDFVG